MPLVSMRELLDHAAEAGYGIPAFNVNNLEQVQAVMAAADEVGAPVIPVAVSTGKCWPREGFVKHPGVVQVSIGPAIPSVGREPKELMREVEGWIEAEMRRIDPDAYPPAV